ncbi:MAG TPA: protein kinase [Gemmatimonadales bacterium]
MSRAAAEGAAEDLERRLRETVAGSYSIEREIGGGGMSRVFVADERRLGRKVVIKVLSPELAQGISIERFEREIRMAASLQHPHIVGVLATGDVDGLPWFSMPFIEGESLRARVARGPLPIGECISILRDVARALAYAHGRNVVHRDIKPDNVMFSAGSAVVTDFGIAKAIGAARGSSDRPEHPEGARDRPTAALTSLGTSIGTPAYMAPEQAAGDPGVDARADVYAFGCTAYELLTGDSPFGGRTAQRMIAAHMTETPRLVAELRPDTPAPLADLVMRSLAKDATDRPQSGADIVRLLDAVASGSAASAPGILRGGAGAFRRALFFYGMAVIAVAVLAKAAIVGVGLPDWVFGGALVMMALGLPVILFTGYAQQVNRRLISATPTMTPGGTTLVPQAHGTMATIAVKATPYLSWSRTARGGMVAVTAFALLVAGFMAMRAAGIGPAATLLSGGTLASNDRIVLGDFVNRTGDSTLSVSLVEAFRIDLEESRSVHLVEPVEVATQLSRMGLPSSMRLTDSVTRDVAQRADAKAYITGEVTPLGRGYVIAARLVDANTGTTLLAARAVAPLPDALINTLDRMSHTLRSDIGESLRQVHRGDPLEQVVTPSMEALRLYSAALRANYAGDDDRAIPLLREAVRADTGFAMAWRKLGVLAIDDGNPAEGDSALAAAMRHLDRLTPYERYLTEGSADYYLTANGVEKSLADYRLALEVKPDDPLVLGNLGETLNNLGRFPEAESIFRRSIAAGAPWGTAWGGLIWALTHQAKWAAADSVPALLLARFGDSMRALGYQIDIARYHRDVPRVDSLLTQYATLKLTGGRLRGLETWRRYQADYHGHFRDAERAAVVHSGLIGTIGGRQNALHDLLIPAMHDALLRDNPAVARGEIHAALQRIPMDSIRPNDRPYFSFAEAAAYAGDAAAVKQFRAAQTAIRASTARSQSWNALQAIAAGQWGAAVTAASSFCDTSCTSGLWYGYLLDRAGKTDSARRVYQRFIDRPTFGFTFNELTFYPIALLRLGELYRASNDPVRARLYLDRFIDLWKSADPELQPMVRRAREALAALGDAPATSALPRQPH